MGEGEWDTWDQVSRKKGKGHREEHGGGERWTSGGNRKTSWREAFKSVLKLRHLKGRRRRLCQANRKTEGEEV